MSSVGQLTAYATKQGLAVFLDFDSGGWTMLTECPSISVKYNADELQAMIAGVAGLRQSPAVIEVSP